MSAKIFVAIVAICVLQGAQSLIVRRDAAPAEKNGLEEIRDRLVDLTNEVTSKVSAAINNEDFKKNFQNNTESVINALQDFANNYQSQISAAGENVKSTFTDAVTKINATITELRQKHPEIETKANEFGNNLKAGIQDVLSQSDKVIKSVAQNTEGVRGDIEKATKEGYNNLLKNLEDLRKRANDAANKA